MSKCKMVDLISIEKKKILWYHYFLYKLSYSLVVGDKAINDE